MLNNILKAPAKQAPAHATDYFAKSQNDKGNKTLRNNKIIYWTGVTLLAFPFLISGFLEVTRNPQAMALTMKLGYPSYFIFLLGVAKITGIAVLLIPNKLNWLKEWVFAGLVFDVIFAFASNYEMGQPTDCVKPMAAFAVVVITYVMFRRTQPRLDTSV